MNSKVLLVLRILLGLFVLIFGANKFLNFLPPPEIPALTAAGAYWTGLSATYTLKLVGLVEILAGLALLLNRYAALMLLILMSVSVNAVLYHLTLDPGSVAPALVLLVLNIVLLYAYRSQYKELLN